MIKFVFEEEETPTPVFGDVPIDRFFVDEDGCLCQKDLEDAYIQIADEEGAPEAMHVTNVRFTYPITRILPKVEKIRF